MQDKTGRPSLGHDAIDGEEIRHLWYPYYKIQHPLGELPFHRFEQAIAAKVTELQQGGDGDRRKKKSKPELTCTLPPRIYNTKATQNEKTSSHGTRKKGAHQSGVSAGFPKLVLHHSQEAVSSTNSRVPQPFPCHHTLEVSLAARSRTCAQQKSHLNSMRQHGDRAPAW